MIGGMRCVSCCNRTREFVSGRDAKGAVPTVVLRPARIGIVINPGDTGEVVIDIAAPGFREEAEVSSNVSKRAAPRLEECFQAKRCQK